VQGADILIGAALLLFGRRLFWLFVGGVGFIFGFDIAAQMLPGRPEWLVLAVALGVGLLGAIFSIFFQRVVVGIAGFFAGAYFLSALAVTALHNNQPIVYWSAFVLGGIIAAILTMALLDPALIILSSLAGATAISQHVPLEESARGILFLVLLLVGIIVQSAVWVRGRKPKPPKTQAAD